MNFDLSEEELPNDGFVDNGPTFEDLAIDDSLSDLDRVAKYASSSIALQRVIHVKMLADTARSVGLQQTCTVLLPLLEALVCDVEYVVRQHVALQFPPLCQFLTACTESDDGYRVLLDKMIPLVAKLVSDKQHEVRGAASESLVAIAPLVKAEDQGAYVLTIVLPLAHDDDNEQFRISAISLYHGLAEHLGADLCQQFCVPELISLSEDPVFRVRKSTAQCFANVCTTAGQDVSRERLLPAFQRLAHDDIWAVRKACVESLVNISLALAPPNRGELLIPLYESFLNDGSRWVRLAAYQSIGPFLASLERKAITDDLLQHFLGMATSAASAQLGGSGELDMRFHCAFSFPALVSIYGRDQWPQFAPTFASLCLDSFWKVRRTLAYSLHELARMLGPEITEKELATAFDAYLKDAMPDIKFGAMVHFADFLEHVSPAFRESYLPVLTELLDALLADQTKWRTREIMSAQLPQLCTLFSEDATFAVIYPLAIKLITDDVAVVRHRSARACPLLVQRIAGNAAWLEDALAKLTALAASTRFTDRQVFVFVCQSFLQDAVDEKPVDGCAVELFVRRLAPVFFSIAQDAVSNVRVVFATMLLQHRDKLVALESCPPELRTLWTGVDSERVAAVEDVMQRILQLYPVTSSSSSSSSPLQTQSGEDAASLTAESSATVDVDAIQVDVAE